MPSGIPVKFPSMPNIKETIQQFKHSISDPVEADTAAIEQTKTPAEAGRMARELHKKPKEKDAGHQAPGADTTRRGHYDPGSDVSVRGSAVGEPKELEETQEALGESFDSGKTEESLREAAQEPIPGTEAGVQSDAQSGRKVQGLEGQEPGTESHLEPSGAEGIHMEHEVSPQKAHGVQGAGIAHPEQAKEAQEAPHAGIEHVKQTGREAAEQISAEQKELSEHVQEHLESAVGHAVGEMDNQYSKLLQDLDKAAKRAHEAAEIARRESEQASIAAMKALEHFKSYSGHAIEQTRKAAKHSYEALGRQTLQAAEEAAQQVSEAQAEAMQESKRQAQQRAQLTQQQRVGYPTSVSFGYEDETGIYLTLSDRRLAPDTGDEQRRSITREYGQQGQYFGLHTGESGFGHKVSIETIKHYLERYGVSRDQIDLLVEQAHQFGSQHKGPISGLQEHKGQFSGLQGQVGHMSGMEHQQGRQEHGLGTQQREPLSGQGLHETGKLHGASPHERGGQTGQYSAHLEQKAQPAAFPKHHEQATTRHAGSQQPGEQRHTLKKSQGACQLCGKTAENVCGNCHKAFYCCKDCQEKDWARHQKECMQAA